MDDASKTLVGEVSDLLDEERQALLAGNMDKIEELLPKKLDLAERLSTADELEKQGLAELKPHALRNQELLNEALKGIKSVADRLAEMRRVRAQLDTYDANGRKQTFHTMQRSVEKRA